MTNVNHSAVMQHFPMQVVVQLFKNVKAKVPKTSSTYWLMLKKKTVWFGIAQSSHSCKAQLFCCCRCRDDINNSGLMQNRFLKEKKKELGHVPRPNPVKLKWSMKTWLVGHPTSGSNNGKLLHLLCNFQPSNNTGL